MCVGVVAAGQLVQTVRDSKIDGNRLHNFRMFWLLLYLVNLLPVPVCVLTFVALSEMSFLMIVRVFPL